MRDWQRFVRERLVSAGLRPDREQRIVRELASNLEDVYLDALRHGASDDEALATAESHVADWSRFAADLRNADPAAAIPAIDVLSDRLESTARGPGVWRRVVAGLPLDVLQALRRLRTNPGFTLTAAIVLAVGIGANAAIFSLVDTFLFLPLPYAQADRLVRIFDDDDEGRPGGVSYPTYLALAAEPRLFERAAPVIVGRRATWIRPGENPRVVPVEWVGSGYFPVTGLQPQIGRGFEAPEDRQGGPLTAVISDRVWREAFDASTSVLGTTINVAGAAVSIVGVAPGGYRGMVSGHRVDLWLSLSTLGPVSGPYAGGTQDRRGDHWFDVLARLAPGTTVEGAQAAANVIAARLQREYPDYHRGRDLTVYRASDVRLEPSLDASLVPAATALAGLAALVLLASCTNLAGLLLVRGWRRGHELAVRLALGASRWRLVRPLIVESVLLGVAGGAGGVVVAAWASRLLTARGDIFPLPINVAVSLNERSVLFTLALSVLTGVAFGTLPALRATRPDLAGSLKEPQSAGSLWTPSRRRFRVTLQGAFLVAQVAVSIVLLAGAGVLVRGLLRANAAALGFDTGRIALMEIDAGSAGQNAASRASFWADVSEKLHRLPGVEALSWTSRVPVTRMGTTTLVIDEYRARTGAETVEVDFAFAAPNYFATMGIPLLHGRLFSPADAEARRPVAVVSEAMARRYWGRSDVTGLRYRREGSADSWTEILGVVGDVKVSSIGERPTPIAYLPLAPQTASRLYAVLRTATPDAVAQGTRAVLRQHYPTVPVFETGSFWSHVDRSLTLQRAVVFLVSLFGLVALGLATTGLYGVVASSVSHRTAEVGVRMALGAKAGHVTRLLIRDSMWLVLLGIALGLAAASALTPGLRTMVFGPADSDPLTMMAVAAVMLMVSLIASWIPARRAVSTGPLAAIRQR